MDEETKKIIAEQMKKLPKDVLGAIASVDYKTRLQEITRRQRLLIDQAGKLEMETTLVMIGLEPLADFVGNLQREMGLPVMRAKEIALDVSENIFKPIRDSLRAMNEPVESEEDVRAMGQTIANENTPLPGMKSTDTSDVNLNRDQILNEIENPSLIDGGNRTMDLTPGKEMEIEIKPTQEIETVPGQGAMEVKTDLLKEKMTGPTIISQQIVDAKPEIKLPEIEKKRPYGGVDPYKEEIK